MQPWRSDWPRCLFSIAAVQTEANLFRGCVCPKTAAPVMNKGRNPHWPEKWQEKAGMPDTSREQSAVLFCLNSSLKLFPVLPVMTSQLVWAGAGMQEKNHISCSHSTNIPKTGPAFSKGVSLGSLSPLWQTGIVPLQCHKRPFTKQGNLFNTRHIIEAPKV